MKEAVEMSDADLEALARGGFDVLSRPGSPLEKRRSRNVVIKAWGRVAIWWRDSRRGILSAMLAMLGMLTFLYLVGSLIQLFT